MNVTVNISPIEIKVPKEVAYGLYESSNVRFEVSIDDCVEGEYYISKVVVFNGEEPELKITFFPVED